MCISTLKTDTILVDQERVGDDAPTEINKFIATELPPKEMA